MVLPIVNPYLGLVLVYSYLFQETRDPVLLVSGKVGAHTRDNETDRWLR